MRTKYKYRQRSIAEKSGFTEGFISQILCGYRRPSWGAAKRIAAATKTSPVLWIDAAPEKIRQVLSEQK